MFSSSLKNLVLSPTQKLELWGLKISHHDSDPTIQKGEEFDSEMQTFDQKSQTNLVRNNMLDRFTLLSGPGFETKIFTNRISATATSVYKRQIP